MRTVKGKSVCKGHFKKPFSNITKTSTANVHTVYKRRSPQDGGRTIEKKGVEYDNGWVVSYNPYLLMKYDCHINVGSFEMKTPYFDKDICSSIKAVRYLWKYPFCNC